MTPTSNASNASQSAAVTFEKATAAKTALLLDNTQLGPSLVQVTGDATLDDMSKSAHTSSGLDNTATGDEVDQEDKPRSRILAEYLAQGYTISDNAITNAIALDNQHGISARFTAALQSFDNKYHATEKAQQVDAKLKVSDNVAAGWSSLSSYFEKALETPTGQKIRDFYKVGNKQVMDVHSEARRLADMKNSHMENVAGTDKTVCRCGGDTGKCPCAEGRCACASCPKNQNTESGPAYKDKTMMGKAVENLGGS